MSRRLFHGQLADEIAGEDRLRAERLRLLARGLVDIVRDALAREGTVRIHGFGTFRLKRTAARRGINPRTGEPIEIPARNRVLFRPAKALRDRIEPEHPAAVPLAEPHESREAWLGGRMPDSPVAGSLSPGDHERSDRSYFPDRVAAASMVTPTARVTASAYPAPSRDSASREASLGGAMADSPSAGRVVTGESGAPGTSSRDADAANDHSAPIEPDAGPDRAFPPPTEPHEARDEDHAIKEPGRSAEPDVPTLTETADTAAHETALEPEPESGRDDRNTARWMILVALVLLAVLLAWWLWPRTEPTPVASIPGVTTTRTGETAEQGEPGSAGESGAASPEPVVSETVPGESADGAGEPASGIDSVDVADSTAEPAVAEIESSLSGQGAEAEPAPVATEPAEPAPATAAAETAPPATSTPWFSGREYSVVAGDTLWDLSDRHYVNPYYWPHIWNQNGSLANPDRIEVDQELWLPRLVGEPRELTAADRRSIAEGYLRLYRFWKDTGAGNPQYALVGVRYFDASVLPPELRNDPSAGRPGDAMAAAFEALLMAEFPAPQ